jgi:hypothetical protein
LLAQVASLQLARGRVIPALQAVERQQRALRQAGRPYAEASDAPPGTHPVGGLAVWHLLYALLGFRMDLARRRLVIEPHLPAGAHSIEAPLFTPACLGWLRFREETGSGYRQRLRVTFDSPVNLDHVQLRVPPALTDVSARLELAEGPMACRAVLHPENAPGRLLIVPARPMHGVSQLTLEIKATARPTH